MGTDGWRSGTSPSSGSRDLQQSHNHPDTQKQPCMGGVGVPHPKAPLSHPWAPQAQRGPLLPIHKEPSTHGSASQGCIFCILLSKVGGGEDAGAKPCRTDLCSGPENGSKLQNSRKIKKKNKPLRLLVHPLVGADRLLSYSYEPAWEEEREHLYLFH